MATEALRNEAREWDTQGGKLHDLSCRTEGMEFGRLEAGLFQMMVGPYNDLLRGMAARCREGAAAMTEIATSLRTIADTYDAEDKAAMHRNKKIY